MSFEICIQSFENGEPAGMPRALIREIFRGYLSESEPDYWQLSFGPRDSCALFLSPLNHATEQVHGITVERPCSDLLLWRGLIQLLANGQTVLYFPGCSGPLLIKPSAASHMPPGLLEALGEPIVVVDEADILRHIKAA
jgi:hypothetical protein